MLSIPRDTFVGDNEETAGGFDKINSLYQKDVKKTVSSVEKITGVKIDYYIVVKTQALIDVVDAIGGVEFEVPIDMVYDDPTQDLHINLKKGMQLLDGDKAEQMLRYRHSNPDKNGKMTTYPASYGSDDFGRMRTQREFIMATAKQLASWKNVSKMKNILNAVFSNLETNMSLGKMVGYIPSVLKIDTEAIRAEQLPGESALINELWFYRQDTAKTKDLVTELMKSLGLSEKEYNKKYTPIKVKNTTKKVDDEAIRAESSLTKNTVEQEEVVNKITTETVNPETCVHDWKLTIELEPSCVDVGARNYRCAICGQEKSEVIPATGIHTWKEISRVEPTETSEGSVTSECVICKTRNVKTLDKLPVTPSVQQEPSNPVEQELPTIVEEPTQNQTDSSTEEQNQDTSNNESNLIEE